MTDVMQRCVPLSTGAPGPDLRVNYQFGLVLGVDEFEQEDRYFRERDERASRSLHGYGTATGLHVTAARPAAAPDDVEVRVEPGIAIDQHGRPVVVYDAQCARIGAWLAAEEARAAGEGAASPLEAHRRPSGDITLYVVASYSSCYDDLVPLPGNPCGADDDVTAPSRIRDSWDLELRWEPPPMPAWDGVRGLADLLLTVDLHDGSPVVSDEALLAAHIRALAPGALAPATPLPPVPVLPRPQARAAIDRLLTIWVTEVRPALRPDLLVPEEEAGVLLSTITLVPRAPFDRASPAIETFAPPDDDGRPYLAPTQLIQELTLLGGGIAVFAGSPVEQVEIRPTIELASLFTEFVGGGHQLRLWSHLNQELLFSPLFDFVSVARNGAPPRRFNIAPIAGTNTFSLRPGVGQPRLAAFERIDVILDLSFLHVRDTTTGVEAPLLEALARAGLDVVGRTGTTVTLHHHVPPDTPAAPAPIEVPVPVHKPVRQVVTALPTTNTDERTAGVELWFHIDKEPELDEERVVDLSRDAITVLAEVEGRVTPVNLPFEVREVQHNVFQVDFDSDTWVRRARRSPYVRVLIKLDQVQLANFGGDLARYVEELGVTVADAQDDRLVMLWARIPL